MKTWSEVRSTGINEWKVSKELEKDRNAYESFIKISNVHI